MIDMLCKVRNWLAYTCAVKGLVSMLTSAGFPKKLVAILTFMIDVGGRCGVARGAGGKFESAPR
jgi:hypothetical protein